MIAKKTMMDPRHATGRIHTVQAGTVNPSTRTAFTVGITATKIDME